jgi:hypothetical protein
MAKGLYQGSYHLVQVSRDRLRVLRRTAQRATPDQEVVSIPLQKLETPRWDARVTGVAEGHSGVLSVGRGTLPADARLAYRVDEGDEYRALRPVPAGWSAGIVTEGLSAREHVITVQATLPDGRAYQRTVPLRVAAGRGTPAPVWTANVGGAIQGAMALSGGGALLVPSMSGALVALDVVSGRERWRVKTGGPVFSTPHADTNTVYFGSADHHVYAADLSTGAVKWRAKTGGAVFAGPATAGGVVCIASADTNIYGLDQATGKTLWTTPGGGLFQSRIATDGERFYVGGWDNFFRALDVKTGREVWKNKFGSSFYFAPAIASPAVGGGRVYVSSNDGLLHAMEAATGKIVWETPALKLGYSSPHLAGERVYSASLTEDKAPESAAFFASTPRPAKRFGRADRAVIYDSSPAVGNGNVFVGSVTARFPRSGGRRLPCLAGAARARPRVFLARHRRRARLHRLDERDRERASPLSGRPVRPNGYTASRRAALLAGSASALACAARPLSPPSKRTQGVARDRDGNLAPRVLVLNFDPIIESEGGKRLNALVGFNDPHYLCDGYVADVRACSGGRVRYNVVEWRDLDVHPSKKTASATRTRHF